MTHEPIGDAFAGAVGRVPVGGGGQEVEMADILELKRRSGGRPRRDPPVGPATVIIFPGVRIERREFSLADRVNPRKTRRSASRARTAED